VADRHVLGLQIDTLAGNYEKMTMIKGFQCHSCPSSVPFLIPKFRLRNRTRVLGAENSKKREQLPFFLVIVPIWNVGGNRTECLLSSSGENPQNRTGVGKSWTGLRPL